MNCLLDTHVFLWSLFSPELLSPKAAAIIRASENAVFLSVVTFWEISPKFSVGKLELTGISPDGLPDIARQMGFDILSLEAGEAASSCRLPRLEHKDPFDRLLIWQAISRKLVVITADKSFAAHQGHGLRTVW